MSDPPRGLRPFLGYQERLIDYIDRFIADLANSGAQIAVLLGALEDQGHERLLELAARREAADAVPRAPTPPNPWPGRRSRRLTPGGTGGAGCMTGSRRAMRGCRDE